MSWGGHVVSCRSHCPSPAPSLPGGAFPLLLLFFSLTITQPVPLTVTGTRWGMEWGADRGDGATVGGEGEGGSGQMHGRVGSSPDSTHGGTSLSILVCMMRTLMQTPPCKVGPFFNEMASRKHSWGGANSLALDPLRAGAPGGLGSAPPPPPPLSCRPPQASDV